MTTLHVRMMGRFSVCDAAGAEVSTGGRKPALLLACLALRPDSPQPRERLADLLWSDRPDAQARASLRQALWSLRAALGAAAGAAIEATGETLTLRSAAVETDVGRLEALLADGRPAALEAALGLWRGRLLEGVRIREPVFEEHLAAEQRRLDAHLTDACLRLLDAGAGAEGEPGHARAARVLLELDPANEAAHRALMLHHARRGDPGLAARQYRLCEETLRRELDVAPGPETAALLDELKGADAAPRAQAEPAGRPARKPAIAVLPFVNLSEDPADAYFSDGLADDLTTALARWRSFPVIARDSSFTYRGRTVEARRIGRELGARYLLEGSVRRAAGRVRANVRLVDAADGTTLWVRAFDRRLADVFELQDEITARIAASLEFTLDSAEAARSAARRPDSLDAWDCCLRGRACLDTWSAAATAEARALFERAVALDPGYSDAFADLAWTHSRDLLMESAADRPAAIEAMHRAARRAVELDPASARARYRLSTAYLWRNEHDLAIAEGQRAVELDPMNAVALHALANKLDLAGDPEGIAMMEEAQALNPQDPQRAMHLTFLARAYVNARDYERALGCARRALRRQPAYANAHYILAVALGHLGRGAEARAALEECERLRPGFVAGRAGWAPYLDPARNAHLHAGVREVARDLSAQPGA